MKSINLSRLQDEASKVIRETEMGEVFEIVRYSKTVAYLISKSDYENLKNGIQCKDCVDDLRKIVKKINR